MAYNLVRSTLLTTGRHQLQFIRHRTRAKPPGEARTLAERLEEINYKDEIYTKKIDIGFPYVKPKKTVVVAERLKCLSEQRKNLEVAALARNHKLFVDLDVARQDWLKGQGALHIKKYAEHYGVYEHLYRDAYFVPRVPLVIRFEQDDGCLCPVYYGNVVKPSEATSAPSVSFDSDDDKSIWTLVLTSLDGHFTDNNKEYVHWFVANIPGNNFEKGETLVRYLQPIPPRGTGYHRYVFVLYKQTKPLDYSISPGESLNDRSFKTRDWYEKHQDDITPAGLAFFQSDWDHSLLEFYHNVLNIHSPVFEYDFPKPYIKKQEWFPLRASFDVYMDRYRDPKQINKEYLLKVLKDEHPLRPPLPKLKFPNAQPYPKDLPSWAATKEMKFRMGWGRINNIE